MPRHNYRVGVPQGGFWQEILNSDAQDYGGSGQGNMGGVEASPASFYGKFDYTLSVTLPPLGSWSSRDNRRRNPRRQRRRKVRGAKPEIRSRPKIQDRNDGNASSR